MPSRSDSVLTTGLSSATVNKAERMRKLREARSIDKQEKRAVLTPVAELILSELKKEKDNTTLQILDVIDSPTEDDYRSTIKALQLYRESLDHLRNRLSNIMRFKDDD
jgi:predicted secreted protein